MPELIPEEIGASLLASVPDTFPLIDSVLGGGSSLSTIAGLGAAGSAISGLAGAGASRSAANTQAQAANNATQAQLAMFNTLNAQGLPYRQTGQQTLAAIMRGIGAPGYDPNAAIAGPGGESALGVGSLVKPFTAQDLNANLAPNWQFALQQGQGAIANAANVSGGLGGNYGKGLIDYTLSKSGDLYQQAFQNYTANQTNIFNRLAAVAGLGQQANQTSAGAGAAISPGIASSTIGQGAAQAAGIVGPVNALTQAGNNALSWYMLPQLMNATG